ncbi:ankyrin and armadillo repeat-containing protein-like [Mya arenaria]|uniref:ankyrin and armadillo repeat-containing protein-like n=1 Tax=Mya arenaria TaxID=6604 RepID=UPI0022DF622C|nr:ankyrin and armadillo repeat-containing protein-like [Mya arenaria]XP_052818749.1 ankyrin and armadillo repeat-containing protein-like [Mya arenaria]XP_052818750.1 ankyrin and armadillo repeat-containing protein-like [Mya arenaria]
MGEPMAEYDEHGWAHIHHAANRGFEKSLERFVHADPGQLELKTNDETGSTPFLIAVTSGNLESITCLINLGSKINAINNQNHGAVEICANKGFIELLEHFISMGSDQLPVWKNLLRFLASESEEEAESAGTSLRTLTEPSSKGEINPHWEALYKNGCIPTIVKVAKSSLNDESKVPAFQVLLNILEKQEVKEQLFSSGGIPAFVRLLKSQNNMTIQLSAQILKELATIKEYADNMVQNNAIPNLLKAMQTVNDHEVLVEAVDCLGNIAEVNPSHQSQIGQLPNSLHTIVGLYKDQKDKALLFSLNKAIGKIANKNQSNQNTIADLGAASYVVILCRTRNKDLQLSSVEAIQALAEDNPKTQRVILSERAQDHLMQVLKKTRVEMLQEKTAMALWALAGDSLDEQRKMAEKMEVSLLIEFVNSLSENLHFIGSEGLGVLAQGPLNCQAEIADANGIHPLVRLLRSDKEYIVLSIIRTLRHLCVGVGYVPHRRNQGTISQSRGIKFLIALMVHSRDEMIQVESALTLGCVSLGNQDILEEINGTIDFSYVRILKMMYAQDDVVRLLAGSALAAFAYNNINQQKEIAEQGGVRFNCFVPFLQSSDEFYRCNAAFQVVILSRIIPDEEQALSSATGIKLLVDLLQDSQSEQILALASDCIARLAHTRAGVPSAIIAINAINFLTHLLLSNAEQVRGCAAIALGYLSHNHSAARQLLNKCRMDQMLMKILKHYAKNKVSREFMDGWKHYQRIGLPPIRDGRTNLVSGDEPEEAPPTPVSGISILESSTKSTSNLRTSSSNLALDEQQLTERTSRMSQHSQTHSGSQMSVVDGEGRRASQASRHSLIQGELQVPAIDITMQGERTGTAEV